LGAINHHQHSGNKHPFKSLWDALAGIRDPKGNCISRGNHWGLKKKGEILKEVLIPYEIRLVHKNSFWILRGNVWGN